MTNSRGTNARCSSLEGSLLLDDPAFVVRFTAAA
jgi:hypothetical protein